MSRATSIFFFSLFSLAIGAASGCVDLPVPELPLAEAANDVDFRGLAGPAESGRAIRPQATDRATVRELLRAPPRRFVDDSVWMYEYPVKGGIRVFLLPVSRAPIWTPLPIWRTYYLWLQFDDAGVVSRYGTGSQWGSGYAEYNALNRAGIDPRLLKSQAEIPKAARP